MTDSVTTTLITNAMIVASLGFVAKSIITTYLKKDVENFKNQIKFDTQKEIDSFKSNLEIERIKLQISYGGIFEKQAEIILELHKKLCRLDNAMNIAVNSAGSLPERREEFRKPWASLRTFYNENRILVPEDIDIQLSDFLTEVFGTIYEYTRATEIIYKQVSDEEIQKIYDKQDELLVIIEKRFPSIREALIEKMRNTIGVGQPSS